MVGGDVQRQEQKTSPGTRSVLKFALAGKQIHFYPVGVLTIVSGFLLASRLAVKFIFHIDRRRRMRAV